MLYVKNSSSLNPIGLYWDKAVNQPNRVQDAFIIFERWERFICICETSASRNQSYYRVFIVISIPGLQKQLRAQKI